MLLVVVGRRLGVGRHGRQFGDGDHRLRRRRRHRPGGRRWAVRERVGAIAGTRRSAAGALHVADGGGGPVRKGGWCVDLSARVTLDQALVVVSV